MKFSLVISSDKETLKEPIVEPTTDFDKEKIAVEFAKVWAEQSKMLWSRLQTVTAIQTGVFAAWYFMRDKNFFLAPATVCLGMFLTTMILLIMQRDTVYLDFYRNEFVRQPPKPIGEDYSGRSLGFFMIKVLLVANALLLMKSLHTLILNY